ncbi:enoyl-CoA hydratase/isomerase family protein [Arthrobacter sp. ISL-30]|uniref:enoyl-CoA hydratase/isomerase family protein n=1 Tax=Arthrobacter sp. ISL-30 TaxID=2819109 RepID=UPI001BE87794|nr:enoyl-CoA hydratase/isomerase family protein [Arthrobacter sp. ISL-30]MBT2514737.1 enoyl-CoA hydratase/isomerase family protein [Arthrobacter sp. ISL-30]
MTGTLRVEYNGPVATIVLDNERRRNAMTKDMWQQFQPLLDLLAVDETVKVVVVRGAAENFSAGADISDLKDILHDPGTGRHDGGHVTAGENALASFHKPTIAAIDGYCIGGGWQIAGACDIRIASDRSTFGITPSKVGIIYPLSGIERLVRLAGPATAKYLLFSGDFIPAAEAMALGLLARVVPQGGFWAEITEFAERLASRSQLSIQAMKDIVDIIAKGGDDPGETSAAWQREMALSGEPEIGIQAFLAKQTPEFKWAGRDSRLFEL